VLASGPDTLPTSFKTLTDQNVMLRTDHDHRNPTRLARSTFFLLDLSSIIYHTGMLEQQEIIIDHEPDTKSDNQSQQDLFWFIDT
jgi:hypothetical protein